jgi:DNA-binding IclR family transcriptional regulator
MSEEELDNSLPQNFTAYTDTTITSLEELKEELKQVAEQGYAIDNEEMDTGVRCVAAPIRDYTRRIVGAISLSGPSMRFTDERIREELVPLVMDAANTLSTRLGYNQ